jgi:hypothetical protein
MDTEQFNSRGENFLPVSTGTLRQRTAFSEVEGKREIWSILRGNPGRERREEEES